MIRTLRKLSRAVNAALLAHFAPFIVWDSHGTKQPCWTMAQAEAWLPFCADRAAIVCANTRTILTVRQQSRAY